ncbi:MAG: hypothetical protein V1829_00775 [bacterium]
MRNTREKIKRSVLDTMCDACEIGFSFVRAKNPFVCPCCGQSHTLEIIKWWEEEKGKETPLSEHNLLQNPTGDKQLTLFAL